MSPPTPQSNAAYNGLRQVVRRPRESDGIGDALRHIYGRPPSLPPEIGKLLTRLCQND